MNENDNNVLPRFLGQWNAKKRPSWAQTFKEPTCTIPDQSMTIQEIIAKFTRTGLVPQSYLKRDEGGNEAYDPDFDPLDQYTEEMAAAQAAAPGSEQAPREPGSEPEKAPQGEGDRP